MSQQEYTRTIEAQLRELNKQIDLKILKGLSYVTESRKHRLLLSKLRPERESLFTKLVHAFIPQH